ncbi:hypothetical protein [Thermocrinis minervae]|uniref:Uncharacterized protein n=1 Tax=Thermocrinis minervae TaxID=381751 RepID=A0A1M6QEH2_9AQUI|nr:hypothetical protein [Thermocrinis minervae]SHK18652.1 hypothetical protein SAMN05444391_0206 [Thermocrinis minervae]
MGWQEADQEILKEIASVGGNYGRRIENVVKALEDLERSMAYLRSRLDKNTGRLFSLRLLIRLKKKRNKLLEALQSEVYKLIVYREALGLTRHKEVYKVYGLERWISEER